MPWFLYHAFKQLFPTGRRFPFFTFMSGLGIAVGVALMLVTSAVMGGFGFQIRKMIVDSEGELQIRSRQGAIANHEALRQVLAQNPAIAATTPTTYGPVMLLNGGRPSYPGFRGVDVATLNGVFDLERFMEYGSINDLDDDSIILSMELARTLQARIGTEVEIYSPLMIERLRADEVMLPQVLRVVGIFQIGHQQLDENLAIGTLRRMQDLYGNDETVERINIRLRPGYDEFVVAAELDETLPGNLLAYTWVDAYGNFQAIIQFEKNMVFFLLAFIVVVAALSIMSSLLISVVRKTREIGLLNALGARSRDVAASFCVQGFLLGIVGTAAGLAIGFLVIHYRNAIMRALANLTAGQDAFRDAYGFQYLPSHLATRDLVFIIIGAILCSALAGLIPAWRAARLKPVEALRSE
jgi:lipoprotein-releasing system permease protein